MLKYFYSSQLHKYMHSSCALQDEYIIDEELEFRSVCTIFIQAYPEHLVTIGSINDNFALASLENWSYP